MIRMRRLRSAVGTILGIALVMGAMPVFVKTVRATDYALWVGSTQVTSSNASGSGWSYDEDSNTLTLNGFSYKGPGYDYEGYGWSYSAIAYDGDDPLTIVLAQGSTNVINTPANYGIRSDSADITIRGSGSLEIKSEGTGISVDYHDITISGGTINTSATDFGISAMNAALNITGGTIVSYAGDGINANDIYISGGTVTATGIGWAGMQAGRVVAISGGTVKTEGSVGIDDYGFGINITGGSVLAIGHGALDSNGEWSVRPNAFLGKVKNSITGTGWSDPEGTQGETAIGVNTIDVIYGDGSGETRYGRVLLDEASLTPATVSKAPAAITGLTANGSAQALVTAGTALGGTMKYALGFDVTEAPTSGWGTKIPTGTDAGTYYVWYMVDGDATHGDTYPKCITVTIAAPSSSGGGGSSSGGGGSSSGGATATPTQKPATTPSSGGGSSSGGATATPTPKPAPSGSSGSGSTEQKPGVADFIERLYNVALGRESDPYGKADWINRVKMQGYTGADLAEGFLYSDEFLGKGLSNDEFLDVLYATFFDRPADQGGKTNWLNAMAAGMTKKQVIRGFIDSTEWANLCLTYGILSGGTGTPDITIEPSYDIRSFVERLYSTCLGREGDPWGMNDWSTQLANMKIAGSECAWGFFFSDEFLNLNLDDAEYITRLYRTFMNREPDPAGFTDWATRLQNGATRQDVFDGFTGSQEWATICADYGILK